MAFSCEMSRTPENGKQKATGIAIRPDSQRNVGRPDSNHYARNLMKSAANIGSLEFFDLAKLRGFSG